MKKASVKNLIKFLSFALITVTTMVLLAHFLLFEGFATQNYLNYSLYYQEKDDSLDLITIGPSTVFESYIPTRAWNKFGITSYNYAANSMNLEVVEMILQEIMRTQSPKTVIIDINSIANLYSVVHREQKIYEFIYCMPPSSNKDKFLQDTKIDLKKRSAVFNIGAEVKGSKSRHELVSYYQNNHMTSVLKGYASDVANKAQTEVIPDDTITPLDEYSTIHMTSILNYCKQFPGTEFLFIKTPRVLTAANIKDYYILRSAKVLVEQYGFSFYDFSEHLSAIGLVNGQDFVDDYHLNYRGACKFTDYVYNMFLAKYPATEHSASTVKNFDDAHQKSLALIEMIERQFELPGRRFFSELDAFDIYYK